MSAHDETVVYVPVDLIDPNPWNKNEMSDRMMVALVKNFERIGNVQTVLLRPKADGRFEIVDGEHRWRASRMTGKKTVPAFIRDLTDAEAKAETLALNKIHGETNAVDEARLIAELEEEGITAGEMVSFSGYDEVELSELRELAEFDWTGSQPDATPKTEGRKDTDDWVTLSFRVPAPVADVVAAELARIKDALGTDHDHLALEVMAVNAGFDDLSGVR